MKQINFVLANILLFMILLTVCPVRAQDGDWEARLDVMSLRVLIGEPVVIRIEIVNHSTGEIVMPVGIGLCARYCGLGLRGPDVGPVNGCVDGPGCGRGMPLPIYLTKQAYEPGTRIVITSNENFPRCPGTYTAQFGCTVPESAAQPEKNLKTLALESNDEVWTGSLSSNEVSFEVLQPEGIDKEAYDAFGPTVVADPRHRGELLQRFPTSTYAAYVVWEKYAEGLAYVDSKLPIDAVLARNPLGSALAPCDAQGTPEGGSETRLDSTTYIRCRDNWMDLVLDRHHDIWFADEIRLRLALDRFQLGDKAACASKLEDLSEHAKPYVSKKARALLEAMQSKNMLPGGPKDLMAAAVKTEPEGEAAR